MASSTDSELNYFCHSSVTWKINNYLNGPLEVDNPIESPEFETNLNGPIKWTLAIIGRRKEDEMYTTEVTLRRSCSCSGREIVDVRVKISMIVSNGNMCYKGKVSLAVGRSISFESSALFQKIIDAYESSKSVPVTIICDFLHNDPYNTNIDEEFNLFLSDLNKLCYSGNLTDLDLKFGNVTFSVHSAIVKARSPYLARRLNKNPSLREIDLTKMCSENNLCALIRYWYTGDIEELPRRQSNSTLRFILTMEQHELSQYIDAENTELSTTFPTDSKSIEWVIEDKVFCEKLHHLDEPIDKMYLCENQGWKLIVYPKGETGDADHISLHVERTESGPVNTVHFQVYLMDEKNAKYCCKSTFSWLHTLNQSMFPEFMKHSDFAEYRKTLMWNNKLRLGCAITIWTGEVINHTSSVSDPNPSALPKEHPHTILANDMRQLLESGDGSDISLKADDRVFRVHKAILAARSKYFENLFNNPKYQILRSYEIKLEDVKNIKTEDLYKVLKNMYYAEKFELKANPVISLYPTLHKYQITRLQRICCKYLINLLPGYTEELTHLVDIIQDTDLSKAVYKHVLQNDEFFAIAQNIRNGYKDKESDIFGFT